jgi:hypothetical protein
MFRSKEIDLKDGRKMVSKLFKSLGEGQIFYNAITPESDPFRKLPTNEKKPKGCNAEMTIGPGLVVDAHFNENTEIYVLEE